MAEGALPNRTGKEDIWSVALATRIEWVGMPVHTFHCFTILHVIAFRSNLCVCVCVFVCARAHAHTYITDITVFEENSSIKLSTEKFNIWKLRKKVFWKNMKRKNWSVWKIFLIKNIKKYLKLLYCSLSYLQHYCSLLYLQHYCRISS